MGKVLVKFSEIGDQQWLLKRGVQRVQCDSVINTQCQLERGSPWRKETDS